MDYLEYAYLQLGRFKDAKRVADKLRAMPPLEQIETKTTYALAAIPARYALERHDWRAAAALQPPSAIDWDNNPRTAALNEYAIGLGAARSGNLERAKQADEKLSSYVDALQRSKEPLWTSMVDVQQKTVAAWRMFAAGQREEALKRMREAADEEDLAIKPAVTPGALLPARELVADMLMQADRPKDALVEYKAVLVQAPNRRNALEGQAKASAAPD